MTKMYRILWPESKTVSAAWVESQARDKIFDNYGFGWPEINDKDFWEKSEKCIDRAIQAWEAEYDQFNSDTAAQYLNDIGFITLGKN